MKRLIKKDNLAIFIAATIGIVVFLASIVWGIICAANNICKESFWYINLEGIVAICLDVLVGVLIAFLIVFIGEKNENNRRKKELIHEILNQIEDYFITKLPDLSSTDLKNFWFISLSGKKMTQQLIDNLFKFDLTDVLYKSFEVLSDKHKEYFDFIGENCFPNAALTEEILISERNLKEEIIVSIKSTICDVYM